MRKLLIPVALLAALAVAAVATAQSQTNTYTVSGKVTGGKGSKAKPKPVSVKFGYTVGEAGNNRPSPVKRYKIDLYGVKQDGSVAKSCTAATINASKSDEKCPSGSQVGSGVIDNKAGATNNIADTSIPCDLKLKVYNSGTKKGALFIFGSPPQCAISISQALPISYVTGSGGGTALQFDIPSGLLHPIPGVDNAVVNVSSTIKKITKGGKGYYSSVACKGSKRPVVVTFTPESGATAKASGEADC